MKKITESPRWDDDLYQLERDDKVEGGRSGAANKQAQQLGNRTLYLKQELDAYSTLIKSGELPFTSEAEARAAVAAGRVPDGALISIRSQNDIVWVEEFKNVGGVLQPTGKRVLDAKAAQVTILPTAEDPTGTLTGLAATVNGQTFRVIINTENDSREIVYKNDNGAAAEVSELIGKRTLEKRLSGSDGETHLEVRDVNNTLLAVLALDGPLYLSGMKDSVQEIASRIGKENTAKIISIKDKVGRDMLIQSEDGKIYIPGEKDALQDKLGKIGTASGPYLNLMETKNKAVYQYMDEFGGNHLADAPGSIQEMQKSAMKRLQRMIDARHVVDIRDYGLTRKNTDTARDLIQRAINDLSAKAGGGVLTLPGWDLTLSGIIEPRSNVSVIGAGKGKTNLIPFGHLAAFEYLGEGRYIRNMVFAGFTIQCENQTLHPTKGYIPNIKGMFFQYYANTLIDQVEILNAGATGFGLDFHDNVWINRYRTENCGRLGTDTATGLPADMNTPILQRPLGGSGVGIGTGAKDVEVIFITEGVNTGNKNFGIFFEPQASGASKGAFCINNTCFNNFGGIADCGIDGLITSGNVLDGNKHNFLLYPGTNLDGKPGRNGIFSQNILRGSLSHNVYSYTHKTDALVGGYSFIGNKFENGEGDGINFRYTNTHPNVKISRMRISGNDFIGCGRHGVLFESGNIVIDSDIHDNRFSGCGRVTGIPPAEGQPDNRRGDAINSLVPMVGCSITMNKIRDIGTEKPTQQYPVNISANLTDVDISFNHCVGNAKNILRLAGQNTRVSTNLNAGITE